MDLKALISRFRTVSGDHGVPPLWPDSEVIAFLNEAEREAAERAKLLHDKSTEGLCTIELIAGQREYFLHPSVFDVEAVSLQRPNPTGANTRRINLDRSTEADMRWQLDNRPNLSGWGRHFFVYGEANGAGTKGKRIVLDRKPGEQGGTLHLEVYRYPKIPMEDPDDEPEIGPRHHDALPHWALYVAYSTRDIEGSASDRAMRHLVEFERRFGARDDANVMRKKTRHRPTVVRMGSGW